IHLLRGIRCKINLIPFNEFPGSSFRRPSDEAIEKFQSILRHSRYDVFLRKSRGRDILGACGQLGNIPP
ncbi:MAG: 23S rRNA (adenine(2503)-C(2))-methyltransferase RlmN, partial [Nitrospirales bacterium]